MCLRSLRDAGLAKSMEIGGITVRKRIAVLSAVLAVLAGCTAKQEKTLTYEAFVKNGWAPASLEVPVNDLLNLARSEQTSPEVAYGAADLVLREFTASDSKRKTAFSVLEKLARDHRQERFWVRAIIHYLCRPDKYEKNVRNLATPGSDNAIVSYALAACELKRWDDEDARKRPQDAAACLAKAAGHVLQGNGCDRLDTYERDAIRADIRALEQLGYSPFAARMVAFFQPETPHMRWMRAIALYYTNAADRDILSRNYRSAQTMMQPVVVMAEKLRANTHLLTPELACIKMTRPALEKLRNSSLANNDYLTSERADRLETDIEARRQLLGDYLAGRNEAMQPERARAKTETEWTAFFDDVLANGEVETIAQDQDILNAVPKPTVTQGRPARGTPRMPGYPRR